MALIGMMKQRIRLATSPARHRKHLGDERRPHLGRWIPLELETISGRVGERDVHRRIDAVRGRPAKDIRVSVTSLG